MPAQAVRDRISVLDRKYPIWRGYFRPDSHERIMFVARPDGRPPSTNGLPSRLTGVFFGMLYHEYPDSFTKYPKGMSASFYRYDPDSENTSGFVHLAHHTESLQISPGLIYQNGVLHADPMQRIIAITDQLLHPGLFETNLTELYHDVCEVSE